MTGEALEVDSSDVDLSDSMAETLKEIQSAETNEVEEDHAEDSEIREVPESAKGERARGEDGRFVKTSEENEEEVTPEEVVEPVAEEVQQTGGIGQEQPLEQQIPSPAEADPQFSRAPSTWRNESKAKWNDIDPVIREEIVKREADYGREINKHHTDAAYGRGVQQSLQPYMPMINASGKTPNEVVTSMLDAHYRLANANPQQKAELLLQTASQFGADMSIMQQEYNPEQNALQQAMYPIQQEVQQLRQQISQQSNQAQQFEQTQAISTIDAFDNATDENGNAKFPYFETVRNDMADLIERSESRGQQLSLEEAYESAIWAAPELRQTLLANQQTNSVEANRKEVAAKAKAAKKAAGVNLTQTGSYDENPPIPTGTVNDTLSQTLAEIKSR